MKLIIPIAAFLSLVQQCQSFLPSSGYVSASGASRTRLHNMILILEEDDEDENAKSQAANSNNGDQPQEIHLVLGGPVDGNANGMIDLSAFFGDQGHGKSRELVDQWKEQLCKDPSPPFTAMRRARLEKEIDLLEKLASGHPDHAAVLKELSSMWINERGTKAAQALKIAGGLANRGALIQAETVFELMIEEEGIHFVQPLNELAAVYSVMGRLKESKELLEIVLEQKPWHFGAIDTMHALCRATDDYEELVKWDRELMPPLTDRDGDEKRTLWAKRMLAKAKAKLAEQERSLHGFFDNSYDKRGSDGSVLLDEEDSWQ